MARSATERLAEKTVERRLLYELETDFELGPAAPRAVLATAQQVLRVSGGEPRQGQMRLTAVSAAETSGKLLSAMKKVSVVATSTWRTPATTAFKCSERLRRPRSP